MFAASPQRMCGILQLRLNCSGSAKIPFAAKSSRGKISERCIHLCTHITLSTTLRCTGFRTYCPVTLVELGELFDCSLRSPDPLIYTVSYRQKFYSLADEDMMRKFMENPDHYTAKFHLLPSKLPRTVRLQSTNGPQFGGHCPVTYVEATQKIGLAPYEGIVKSTGDFTAEYDSKYYSMASQEKLALFMR